MEVSSCVKWNQFVSATVTWTTRKQVSLTDEWHSWGGKHSSALHLSKWIRRPQSPKEKGSLAPVSLGTQRLYLLYSWPILLSNKYTWKWVPIAKAHDILYISFITLSTSDLTMQFTKALLIWMDRYAVCLLNSFFSSSIQCTVIFKKKQKPSIKWFLRAQTEIIPT